MSYILDALKKAEADRDPEARASLAMAQHERRRNRWLAYAAVIALIANAAILLWLFMPEAEQMLLSAGPESAEPEPSVPAAEAAPRSAEPVQSTTHETAPPPARQIRPPAPTRAAQTTQRLPAATDPMAAESATGETIIGPNAGAAAAAEPEPVSSLPAEQRRRFPSLTFSTHIYADDADLRAIVVNGTRLQEGDRLENLRLEEITEDGAVFRFENRLVSVSVLDAWD